MENNFTLRGKNGKELILSNYFLNDDGQLEFRSSSLFSHSGVRYLFNRESLEIELIGLDKEVRIPISRDEGLIFFEKENEIKRSLNALYANILSGEEKLICFPTGIKDFPLHITTETILNEGMLSPKYVKGFVYALLDPQLKKSGYKEQPGFKGYEDIQERLAKNILSKKFEIEKYVNTEAYVVTLRDAIEGI